MPVIINEFEVISEPPPPPANAGADGPPQPAGQPLRPVDITRIHEHHAQRMARVEADGGLPESYR